MMGFRKAFPPRASASMLALVILTTTFSLARASDEQWGHELFSPVAGMPIIGKAPIQAMTVAPNGALIYAGAFLDSDDGSASVVSFSNSRRTGLAQRPTVYAVATDKTNLYVGGDFKGMPGAAANNLAAATNLARWDGSQWWPVGGNVSGVVRA